jgi:hypothetical protein
MLRILIEEKNRMVALSKAEKIKRSSIIDMAITFTAMTRVFEKNSKPEIAKKLEQVLAKIESVETQEDFETLHSDFCVWFVNTIRTAEKNYENNKVKPSMPASYGHAAKVFDIVSKVYVYYSSLPSCTVASILIPYLHGAIDTQILTSLKSKYPNELISASSIEMIDKVGYEKLQKLIGKHIIDDFDNGINPVQYDDIQWYGLNRK